MMLPPRTTPSLAFDIAGRLFAIAVLAFSILRGGSPLLFLWGLWIEEVFALAGLSIRQAIARRRGGAGRATPLALYAVFPAVHLVFVLVFSLAGVTGLFAGASAPLLALPRTRSVLVMAGALLFWTVVDCLRALLGRRAAGSADGEQERIDREARLALFLPHLTIIAGGFCLIMFRLAQWLAWGILAGRVLFEAVAFFARREVAAPTASGREF